MRILLMNRHCRLGPSSRLRYLQYIPKLNQCGVRVDINALYDETYLKNLYSFNKRSVKNIACNYLRRLGPLLSSGRYDLLWLEQELFPWLPPLAEWLLHIRHIPVVVDYDDAIFHRYDRHGHWMVRRLLGEKIDRIMQFASCVIAGNSYIARRAYEAGAETVAIIPTVIDLDRYKIEEKRERLPLTVGWIGSPSTFSYFRSIAPVLIELQKRLPIRVAVVGVVNREIKSALPFNFYEWSEDTEVALLKTFDIGIMPLPDTPWTKGKCGYKLIQYMACGLPVVASRVGANIDIVNSEETGFLVSKNEEWAEAIERLATDAGLRESMGKNGRRRVEMIYNIDRTFPTLARCLLRSAAG
jgi:glycosyltransferase involved in cell wall biosynthesis